MKTSDRSSLAKHLESGSAGGVKDDRPFGYPGRYGTDLAIGHGQQDRSITGDHIAPTQQGHGPLCRLTEKQGEGAAQPTRSHDHDG